MSDTPKKKAKKVSSIVVENLKSYDIGRCAGRPYFINGIQALEIGSIQHKDFIARYAYVNLHISLSESQIREIAQIQRGQALFGGKEKPVGVRVMALNGKRYLDLCDNAGTVLEIDSEGWRPCKNPPVYFFRPPHLKPLPMPLCNGNIDLLKTLLSFSDDDSFKMIRGALLFYLNGRPGDRGTFPIIKICGPSGSAKTTSAKIIKYIIDPAIPEGRTITKEARDLYISAKNQYVLVFDNVSRLDGELQDALCSLSSRGGFSRKKNYSDDDETIFEDCRPIIINGITFKTQQDLQGRMVNIDLLPIPDTQRKTEEEIWNNVDEKRPLILGGLLDALSKTIKEIGNGK